MDYCCTLVDLDFSVWLIKKSPGISIIRLESDSLLKLSSYFCVKAKSIYRCTLYAFEWVFLKLRDLKWIAVWTTFWWFLWSTLYKDFRNTLNLPTWGYLEHHLPRWKRNRRDVHCNQPESSSYGSQIYYNIYGYNIWLSYMVIYMVIIYGYIYGYKICKICGYNIWLYIYGYKHAQYLVIRYNILVSCFASCSPKSFLKSRSHSINSTASVSQFLSSS
jgi:hypothetical protein